MPEDGEQPGSARGKRLFTAAEADETHVVPVDPDALQSAAYDALEGPARDFLAGGAGSENTPVANRDAFRRWRLVPRHLRDVSTRALSIDILDTSASAPIFLAPIGLQSLYDDEAELASARAAASVGLPFVASTNSTAPLEDIGSAVGEEQAWFQLYVPEDRPIAESFIDRAEAAGFEALVVTVDAPVLPWRERVLERSFLPFLDGEGIGNYLSDPAFRARLDDPPETDEQAAIDEFMAQLGNPAVTAADIAWVVERTDLPVVVKGILDPGVAEEAIAAGADGLWVSNHGGRQVDGAIPALDALRGVVTAVDEAVPIVFDSGVRRGADVLKALALGADAVAVGRPYIWGLVLEGERGVEAVLKNLVADLDLTLGMCGRTSIADVDRDLVVPAGDSP